ncbi:MAG: ribose-phosphate pyrophosphokinase, partial [Clostridia bacterium]|nr:ribose-phosphate pyrophosphokinase [Clostridia bacterium]
MITHGNSIKLFAGNASKQLATEIASLLKMEIGEIEAGRFSDGETMVNIHESVRGRDVFVIQSTAAPTNDNLMELLVMIDALKRASAGRVTAVLPYFGYARQDRKARSRDPITAKLVANLITVAGADRVLTMDLHAAQLQGFFDIPVDHLYGAPVLTDYLIKNNYRSDDLVIVSPDVGSVKRARNLAARMNAPIAIIDKRRPGANAVEIMNIIGDVQGKRCIMVDDMIDTAGTIVQGADALVANGAKEVIACCTHAVLSGPALERLQNSVIKEVITLNTYEHKDKLIDKLGTFYIIFIMAVPSLGYIFIFRAIGSTMKLPTT